MNDYISNIKSINNESTYTRDINDNAKITIKQTTEHNNYIGSINNSSNDKNYVKNNDNAKPTIKQTTIINTHIGHIKNVSNDKNYIKNNDNAKPTIKQTTIINNYVGGIKSEIDAQISHESANNMEIDDKREISTFNRTPNGRSDSIGPYIDVNNVQLSDELLYSYVAPPCKKLDNNILPSTCHYPDNKNVLSNSEYYISNDYINTLDTNPLVNDIMHPKNFNYD